MTAAGYDAGRPAAPGPAAPRSNAATPGPRHAAPRRATGRLRPPRSPACTRLPSRHWPRAVWRSPARRRGRCSSRPARRSNPSSGRLLLPVELVRAAVALAPASFVMSGRVAERDVTIGGGPGGLMAATAAAPDVAAAALLADALPEVAVIGLPTRRLGELPAAVAASAKPLLVCGALSAAQAAVVVAVAAALAGRADRGQADGGQADGERTDSERADNEHTGPARPPVGVVSTAPSRSTSIPCWPALAPAWSAASSSRRCSDGERPADRSAALIAIHAAALAACAAAQLAAPGAPYLVPALASAIEDHAPGFGLGPAGVATFTQLAQLAAHAGLPIAAGFPPTRPAADEWLAAADGTFVALAAALGGASLLAVAGHTDEAGVFSPAQLVLDAETWSNVAAVAAGITVDDETLALETIAAVGIGGNALAQRHTRRHMKDVWKPRLFDRTTFDAWEREGRRSAPQRAADAGRRTHRRSRGAAARRREGGDASAYHARGRTVIRFYARATQADHPDHDGPVFVAGSRPRRRGAGR